MRTDTHLTIQDYFKRGAVQKKSSRRSFQNSFSNALEAARSSSAKSNQGLTIRDYMQRPVAIQNRTTSTDTSGLSSRTCSREPVVEPFAVENRQPDPLVTADHQTAVFESVEDLQAEGKDKILASIDRAAARYKLPTALIEAVVKAESNYRVRAVSPAGAQGLMQLMPATAKELGVEDPFDIEQNIDGGAQYLRNMLNRFDGDMGLALSAYNAGPGTVARYRGQVPYAETQSYVRRVLRYVQEFSAQDA